jgi:hypothetical protein
MSTIQDLFQQSQLAEAAYANFVNGGGLIATGDELKTALIAEGFSESQAADFVTHWQVVSQQPDTASGFSATVFERLDANQQPTGQYSLAIRGTINFDDFSTDASLIASSGVAISQMLDMYNYWQSLTTAGVYKAAKLETRWVESAILEPLWAAALLPGALGEAGMEAYLSRKAELQSAGYFVDSGVVSRIATGDSNVLLAGKLLGTEPN